MAITWQDIAIAALCLLSGGGGWFLRQLWEAVTALKKDLSSLERDMRQNFARRDDVRDMFDQILKAIARLHDDVSHKADK